jgi:hypothetical protein
MRLGDKLESALNITPGEEYSFNIPVSTTVNTQGNFLDRHNAEVIALFLGNH